LEPFTHGLKAVAIKITQAVLWFVPLA